MKCYYIYETVIGNIAIIDEDSKLDEIILNSNNNHNFNNYIKKETKLIKKVIKELNEYFNGLRKTFDIPLNINGTPFQKKVYDTLLKIDYGKKLSYSKVAQMIKSPKASRAVGNANNKNKIPIIIPCHRVIAKDGSLSGFGAGINIKKFLLELEEKNK